MSFERARLVADAVLFEGYALYPYRKSSRKNLSRWQFGVLAPRAFSEGDGGEPWWMETEILVAPAGGARLTGKLRFMRLRRRRVRVPDERGALRPVDSVDVEGRLLVAWDEGDVREVDFEAALAAGEERRVPFALPGDVEEETVRSRTEGQVAAKVERRAHPLEGVVSVRVAEAPAARTCLRVTVRVENHTPWTAGGTRDEAMAASMLGAHLLLSAPGSEILSLIDPPDWAAEAASACKNVRAFPVLAGERSRTDVALASPIILYDWPEVAPESPGDLFDATEIDEILTLRTRTLTEDEKREARATDPRIAALIDRVDAMSPEALERLHGAFRDPRGTDRGPGARSPRHDRAFPAQGDRVRLRPGKRRTDAQDMFLEGMTATVREVKHDVDGQVSLAVTLDDDPAAELHMEHGRFHYFYLDEVEPLGDAPPVTSS